MCYDEDVGAETALLASELQGLRDIEPTHPATTLVIFPQRQSFAALMELQSIAEALADASYEEAPVQVLAFHPHGPGRRGHMQGHEQRLSLVSPWR